MKLYSKILAYLTQQNIEVIPNAVITGVPAGQEDQILFWDTATLGPQPTQEQLDAAGEIQLATETAVVYKALRAPEYPSFADQFDLLYHGGYDAWKVAIQSVKDKYPKPE